MKTNCVFFLIIFMLSIVFNSSSQTFQKTYGGINNDYGQSVAQTTDSGFIIAGVTYSYASGNINCDMYLIKTDVKGDTVWTKTFGNIDIDRANSVAQTLDGGYILTGSTSYFSGAVLYLVKTDSFGNILWSKTIPAGIACLGNSVRQVPSDSGYIIGGSALQWGMMQSYVYLIRTDSQGDTLWVKTFGENAYFDGAYSVTQADDGGFAVSGYTISGAGGYDIYIVKFDAAGNMLWKKSFGGTANEYGYSIARTSDNGYIISGSTNSFGAGVDDVYLIKTNDIGDTLWTRTYGGSGNDQGYFLQQTFDNGFIVCGSTNSFGAGSNDVYIIKTDSSGNVIWSKTYGGSGNDNGHSIYQTLDNGYIITGVTESFGAGDSDVYLIKTDAFGNSGCNEINVVTIMGTPPSIVSDPVTIFGNDVESSIPVGAAIGNGSIVNTLCTNVNIKEITIAESFIIYPNPAQSKINIKLKVPSEKFEIKLFDVTGQIILEKSMKNISNSINIALPELSNGIYFLNLRNEKYNMSEKVFIKN
ncbi:MAG TPA: T9SS type A sorting domain-containing protein [Bacteroidia bacterium]|nr:T9SS type A sorting domain-containing protein [Bacteroidia bacterium]